MDSLKDCCIIYGISGTGAMIFKYFSKKSPIKTDIESIDRSWCIC